MCFFFVFFLAGCRNWYTIKSMLFTAHWTQCCCCTHCYDLPVTNCSDRKHRVSARGVNKRTCKHKNWTAIPNYYSELYLRKTTRFFVDWFLLLVLVYMHFNRCVCSTHTKTVACCRACEVVIFSCFTITPRVAIATPYSGSALRFSLITCLKSFQVCTCTAFRFHKVLKL